MTQEMSENERILRQSVADFIGAMQSTNMILEQILTALTTLERAVKDMPDKTVLTVFLEQMDKTLFGAMPDGKKLPVWGVIREIFYDEHRARMLGGECHFLSRAKEAFVIDFMKQCPAYDESDILRVKGNPNQPLHFLLEV